MTSSWLVANPRAAASVTSSRRRSDTSAGQVAGRERRQDRLAGGADRDRMPRPGPLRDRRDRVTRLDARERDALVVIEHDEEARRPELVRDGRELGERLGLQIVRDAGRQRGHPRAELDAPGAVAGDESVVLERAQQPVRDRAVHAEAAGDLVDRQRLARVGEDLEDPDAAAQRLRGRRRGGGIGRSSRPPLRRATGERIRSVQK